MRKVLKAQRSARCREGLRSLAHAVVGVRARQIAVQQVEEPRARGACVLAQAAEHTERFDAGRDEQPRAFQSTLPRSRQESPSSLKTASVSCATHHAHDMQKTKEHSVSWRSEWNMRRYVRNPRVARKMLESLIGGACLYARTTTFQKGGARY